MISSQMNQKLAEYEYNERLLTGKLLKRYDNIDKFKFTSGRICFDTEIHFRNGVKALMETKVRTFEIDRYEDYILQVDKLKSLIKKAQKKGSNAIFYVNFFNSDNPGVKDFIIFDLTSRIQEWKTKRPQVKRMYMNAVTYLGNQKIEKEVIMLRYDENIDRKGQISLN